MNLLFFLLQIFLSSIFLALKFFTIWRDIWIINFLPSLILFKLRKFLRLKIIDKIQIFEKIQKSVETREITESLYLSWKTNASLHYLYVDQWKLSKNTGNSQKNCSTVKLIYEKISLKEKQVKKLLGNQWKFTDKLVNYLKFSQKLGSKIIWKISENLLKIKVFCWFSLSWNFGFFLMTFTDLNWKK